MFLVLGTALLAFSVAQAAGQFPIGLGAVQPPQPLFAPPCAPPADPLQRAVWAVTTTNGTRPDLSCWNTFVGYLHTPRSDTLAQDAFDDLAAQIRAARSEVLISNMQWSFGPGLPGTAVAQAVADLYAQVSASPAQYPQGVAVRLSLGGYPDFQRTVDGATQALLLMRELRRLNVPLEQPLLGWRLSILNYPYFPHSHVKMDIIDGKDITVSSYNLSWVQRPVSEGGKGQHDTGLHLRGPVAQAGVAVFDDLWRHSQQLFCPPDVSAEQVFLRCQLGKAEAPSHPITAQLALPARELADGKRADGGPGDGEGRAYLLYRRVGDNQADRGHLALIGAAQRSIDLMQVDFSPELSCLPAHLGPDGCGAEEPGFPVYLKALLAAMERGVKVRALLMPNNIERLGNRSAVALLRYEAKRRGLEDRFDARYVTFDMHDKSLSFDGKLVLVGSMNFHFSAWGPLGLNEAALVSDDPQAVQIYGAEFEQDWNSSARSRPIPLEPWLKTVTPDLAQRAASP